MRPAFGLLIAGLWLARPVAYGGEAADPERVAQLLRQLGDRSFARREAASRDLEALGEPALEATRKASLDDDDPEIRRRAAAVVVAVNGRLREAAEGRELNRLRGTWTLVRLDANGARQLGEDANRCFTVTGNEWTMAKDGVVYQSGTIRFIDPFANPKSFDLVEGNSVYTSIYAIDGDSLYYCTGPGRPKRFAAKAGDGFTDSVWKRKRP